MEEDDNDEDEEEEEVEQVEQDEEEGVSVGVEGDVPLRAESQGRGQEQG